MIERETFLAAPIADVVAVAPKTVMMAITGTRRAAALANMPIEGAAYVGWARQQMIGVMELLFTHGVEQIIATAVVPANLVEYAAVRDRYLGAAVAGMTNAEALADYRRMDCRARLLSVASLAALRLTDADLRRTTASATGRTLCWLVTTTPDDAWRMVLEAIQSAEVRTRADAIRAVYGEDIPPATMFLGFGKPIVNVDFMPPLLIGDMQCYWSQRPGFSLDAPMLRRMIYDYAYVRHTRAGQPPDLGPHAEAWSTDVALGIGRRLGGFWYPAPFLAP